MAVWAIAGMGIRCIIAPSFGEIFFNNCFKNGLLPIVLPKEAVEDCAQQARRGDAEATFTIDLKTCEITTPAGQHCASKSKPPGVNRCLKAWMKSVRRSSAHSRL